MLTRFVSGRVEGVKKSAHPVGVECYRKGALRSRTPPGVQCPIGFKEGRESERMNPIRKYYIAPLGGVRLPNNVPIYKHPIPDGVAAEILSRLRSGFLIADVRRNRSVNPGHRSIERCPLQGPCQVLAGR